MDTPALAAAPTDAAKPDAEKREKDEGLGMIHIKPRYVYATVANHLYDHPFQMLVTLSTPIIGGFFYTEMQKPGKIGSEKATVGTTEVCHAADEMDAWLRCCWE